MEDSFDAILTKLGTGKWTLIYVFANLYWYSMLPYHALAGVFMAPQIDHECISPARPSLAHSPYAQNLSYATTPNSSIDESCSYLGEDPATGGIQKMACNQWRFDNSTFTSTVTSEFELVCEKRFLQPTFSSIYMIGMMFGSFFSGFMADKYGRWTIVAISTCTFIVVSIGSAWLPSISWIFVARFILGMMHPASLQTSYILVMEVTEVKMRVRIGLVQFISWTLATMLFSGWAYLIRDWRWLQMAVSLPTLLFIPVLWVIGESPRWLAVVGQHERALKELKRAARLNNKVLPPDEELLAIMKSVQEQAVSSNKSDGEKTILRRVVGFYDQFMILFRSPKLRLITFVMCIQYFVVAMLFFGLTTGASTLGVDPFMYLAISAVSEIPASTLIIPLIEYFGRKKITAFSYLFCAGVLLAQPPIPEELKWLSVTLVMLGKMSAAMSFAVVFLYALELFPTEIRTQGFGAAMVSSRLGAVVSPFIMSALNPDYPWAVSLVFGAAALIAGIVVYPLWETKGALLPDTIAQLEGAQNSAPEEKHTEKSNGTINSGFSNNEL